MNSAINDNAAPRAAAFAREEARLAEVARGHWTGEKYRAGQDMAEVTRAIRADIKAAIKAGDLPALKVSVRLDRYAGGRTVRIEVQDAPGFIIANPARVIQDAEHPHGVPAGVALEPLLAPEAELLLSKIERIANAYNFDRSDTLADYHHQAFCCDVEFASGLRSACAERCRATLRELGIVASA